MQVKIILATAPTAIAITAATVQQIIPIDTKVTTERILVAMREE